MVDVVVLDVVVIGVDVIVELLVGAEVVLITVS